MTSSALRAFSEKFPTDKPCTLWQAVQTNKTHSDPAEKQAVARAMVKDLLASYAHDYLPKFWPNKGQCARVKKAESLAKRGKVMNAY